MCKDDNVTCVADLLDSINGNRLSAPVKVSVFDTKTGQCDKLDVSRIDLMSDESVVICVSR